MSRTSRGNTLKLRMMASTALIAAICGGQAQAQTKSSEPAAETPAEQDANSGSADIVVTAQRREERLQDVPIAISALGSESLERRGVESAADLTGVVPSLTITNFAGVNAGALVSVRGITGQALGIGASQATAIYIDGVYLSRPDAALFGLDDVERVEVLRGPQGTLYGRNATAGAINIITRTPGTTTQGGINVSYGNFNTIAARGSVTGPLSDSLSGGFSGSYDRHDGYFHNSLTGHRIGEASSYTVRGKLRYESGGFDATIAGDYTHTIGHQFFKNAIVGGVNQGIGDPRLIPVDYEDFVYNNTTSYGTSLLMNLDASENIQLTSITSYRDISILNRFQQGPTANAGLNKSKTFSQEIRALYDGGPFRLTLGANYYHEDANLRFGSSPTPPTVPVVSPFDTTKVDAFAVFGQAEYDITSTLTLVGGLRYNREIRDFTIDYTQAPVPGRFASGNLSDSVVLPSVGLNFKPQPGLLFYVKASEGYQAPGFNFLPGLAAGFVNGPSGPFLPAGANAFGPETLWAYEVGAKTEFFDRTVTLNVAGFYYDYKDIQIRSTVGNGVTQVSNAASAKVKGGEVELTVRPASGLSLFGHVTYADSSYGAFCEAISGGSPQANDPLCSNGAADRSGNRLNQAPLWTGGVGFDWTTRLSDGVTLNANANYSFETQIFYTTANEEAVSNPGGWDRLDARLGFGFEGGFEVYLFGRNLTDTRYAGWQTRISPTIVITSISDPRTYGVGAKFRF